MEAMALIEIDGPTTGASAASLAAFATWPAAPGTEAEAKKSDSPWLLLWNVTMGHRDSTNHFHEDISWWYIYVYISNYICIYSVQYIRYIPVWSFCWINVPHHLIVIQMYIQISRNCEYAGLLVVFWSWEHHPILRQTPRTSSENTQRWVGERPVGDIYIYIIYINFESWVWPVVLCRFGSPQEFDCWDPKWGMISLIGENPKRLGLLTDDPDYSKQGESRAKIPFNYGFILSFRA